MGAPIIQSIHNFRNRMDSLTENNLANTSKMQSEDSQPLGLYNTLT